MGFGMGYDHCYGRRQAGCSFPLQIRSTEMESLAFAQLVIREKNRRSALLRAAPALLSVSANATLHRALSSAMSLEAASVDRI